MALVQTKSVVKERKLPAAGRIGMVLLATMVLMGTGFTRPPAPAAKDKIQFYEARRVSLVIALHPECPCSKANVTELIRMYHRAPEEIRITVLAFTPENDAKMWDRSGLLAPLTNLQARIIVDTNGLLAHSLGMEKSGHAQLFSPNGKVLYDGGITDSCGRSRENASSAMVMQIVYGAVFQPENFPVNGCPLFEQAGPAQTLMAHR